MAFLRAATCLRPTSSFRGGVSAGADPFASPTAFYRSGGALAGGASSSSATVSPSRQPGRRSACSRIGRGERSWLIPVHGVKPPESASPGRRGLAGLSALSSSSVFFWARSCGSFVSEGAKFAAYASGVRIRASGMSYFNIGGNTGYASRSRFATGQLGFFDRACRGGLICDCPLWSSAASLMRLLPFLSTPGARAARPRAGPQTIAGAPIARLGGVIEGAQRGSWPGCILLAFVPLWVVAHGHSKEAGNWLLFAMLLAGCGRHACPLARRPMGDRFRRTLLVTQTADRGPLVPRPRPLRRGPGRRRADARRRLRAVSWSLRAVLSWGSTCRVTSGWHRVLPWASRWGSEGSPP